jgi:hypothetical protein
MEKSLAVITPASLAEAKDYASSIAQAATLGAMRGKPADILAALLAGQELGLAPMQSLRAFHVIDGKPSLSADALAALCVRSPLCDYLLCEGDEVRATATTQRRGSPKPVSVTFSMADAQRAGLAGRGGWQKYPAAMLRARAIAGVCRLAYPDLCLGLYDPDELAPESRTERPAPLPSPSVIEGEVVESAPVPPPSAPVEAAPEMGLAARIEAAQSQADLDALVPELRSVPKAQARHLRDAWGARRDAIRSADAKEEA